VSGAYLRAGVAWLSRLHFGTAVFRPGGAALTVRRWLAEQPGPVVDRPILLGTRHRVACRLVAWRVPAEVAARRRQRLVAAARGRDGRTPGRERLAWCDWTILVTGVPPEVLTPEELAALYRARWQIELLFKRWKSLGAVAELRGATAARQMVRFWSRLLAVVVQHWLVLAGAWGDPRVSLAKAARAVRRSAWPLALARGDTARLEALIEQLAGVVRTIARQTRRRSPSTFDLLNDPSRLGYF
jgi:hypothetical protein